MFQINSFDLYQVLTFLFAWTTLYFLLCLSNSRRSYEWHCRMLTVLHALLVSSLACYSTFVAGPWPFTDASGPNTPLQIKIVNLCLGYFLFDFSWCMYFKTEGPVMMAHHFLSIVGLTWCLFAGRYGTELVATIGGAEVTNPLLQLRWFLRETGHYKGSIWGHLVDWAFMLSFGFVRIILGSILLYSYYQQNTDFWGRLGGTIIYSIGWIFFINIVNYAIRKYLRIYNTLSRRNSSPSSRPREENGANSESGVGFVNTNAEENTSYGINGGGVSGSRSDLRLRNGKSNGYGAVGVIEEKEIPSQREIKDGDASLAPGESLIVTDCLRGHNI